jgi:dolichol-phosphate mannosyltransferase
MKKVAIIIPAYNEEQRIKNTLNHYLSFFQEKKNIGGLNYEIIVVLNGCIDNTEKVVMEMQNQYPSCLLINLTEAGKGLAIRAGFMEALKRKDNTMIGFVDADMATSPEEFYKLIENIKVYDGIIASRYMPGAQVFPPRPKIKRWGSKIIYESLVKLLLGLSYHDLQCGAKVFTYGTIEKIIEHMRMTRWAFDVELLYLCKRFGGASVIEYPTVWHDQVGSKLRLGAGFIMLGSLFKLRARHSFFARPFRKDKA